MWGNSTYILLLSFVWISYGIKLGNVTVSTYANTVECKDKIQEIADACLNDLKSLNGVKTGIPYTPEKIERNCRIFFIGMKCVDDLSSECLSKKGQELLGSSTVAAFSFYKDLCTNVEFREQFIKHSNCYQRASEHLEECNKKTSVALKKIDRPPNDFFGFCCIWVRYTQCVYDVTKQHCSKASRKYVIKIIGTLMQLTLQSYQRSHCVYGEHKSCSSWITARSATNRVSATPFALACVIFIEGIMWITWIFTDVKT